MKLTADILGHIVTVLCIISVQMKKKWQMLILSSVANFVSALSFMFLARGFTSAASVCFVAVLQTAITSYNSYHGKKTSKTETIVFLFLYLMCGIINFKTILDVMPIVCCLIFMIGNFQKEEQKIRIYGVANSSLWIVYDVIVKSTAVYSHIFTITSLLIALYRYRKKEEVK